jgi:hypothetical protein
LTPKARRGVSSVRDSKRIIIYRVSAVRREVEEQQGVLANPGVLLEEKQTDAILSGIVQSPANHACRSRLHPAGTVRKVLRGLADSAMEGITTTSAVLDKISQFQRIINVDNGYHSAGQTRRNKTSGATCTATTVFVEPDATAWRRRPAGKKRRRTRVPPRLR